MAHRDGLYQRGNAWWLHFCYQGERYQESLGRGITRKVAQELAQVRRSAILRGEAGIGKKRKDLTFGKAKGIFLEAAEANNRYQTVRSYRKCLEELEKTIGEKYLSEISSFLIEKHKQRRVAEGAPVAFNRELGTFKTLFNWFIDNGKFEGTNPARKVKKIKESPGRDRFLEHEEEERLLAACAEPLRTILMAGIYAGLRIPSETLNLKWVDVDLRRGLLTVQGAFAKNGKTEPVPMTSKLRDALERLKANSRSEYVFAKANGKPYKTVQNIFRTACKKAGLTDISPHVMRHTFGSRLGMAGVDPRTIQELGRWSSLAMVQRYTNLSKTHKAEAIEKLSAAPKECYVSATVAFGKPVS
jgi:integrase